MFDCPILGAPVTKERCQEISSIAKTNEEVCGDEHDCNCPFRLCYADLKQGRGGGAKLAVRAGLCDFHLKNGPSAKPSAFVSDLTKQLIAAPQRPGIGPRDRMPHPRHDRPVAPRAEAATPTPARTLSRPPAPQTAKPSLAKIDIPRIGEEHKVAADAHALFEKDPAATPDPQVGELCYIDWRRLTPLPGQPRLSFDFRDMTDLIDSLRENGQVQPAIVVPWGDGFRIIAGERRWRGCRELDRPVFSLIRPPCSYFEQLVLAGIENTNRRDTTPYENAIYWQRLYQGVDGRKMTLKEISITFGVTTVTVDNYLKVLRELHPETLALMDPSRTDRKQLLGITVALRLTAIRGTEEIERRQVMQAQEIVGSRMRIRQACQAIDQLAKELNIKKGRGLEKKGYDHRKSLERALHAIEVPAQALIDLGQVELNSLFRRYPREVLARIQEATRHRRDELQQLAQMLETITWDENHPQLAEAS